MPSRSTILRYSKDSERAGGRWLLLHDGPDQRPGFAPGAGLVTSTGRIGHIHELQYDLASRSYAGENKNILLNKTWAEWWLKVIAKAADAGKQPLLRIDPSNKPVRIPDMHIITEERHAQLLAAERFMLAAEEHVCDTRPIHCEGAEGGVDPMTGQTAHFVDPGLSCGGDCC